jgi:RNA polymerase sigma-70 factor (ECF subfamily)
MTDGLNKPSQEFRPGDREDFDRLYRESYPRLFRTLYGVLGDPAAAEDCVQECFLKAFQAWPSWRPNAPAEAWLHRIAINLAVTHRRKLRLREVGELVRRLGRPAAGQDPSLVAERSDLVEALRQLPAPQSAAIVLRHYHGYSNRELAQALGVSERTIGSRLALAQAALRARLGPDWGELPTSGRSNVEVMGKSRIRDV